MGVIYVLGPMVIQDWQYDMLVPFQRCRNVLTSETAERPPVQNTLEERLFLESLKNNASTVVVILKCDSLS